MIPSLVASDPPAYNHPMVRDDKGELREFVKDRVTTATRIATCLAVDGALFVFWAFVAWLTSLLAGMLKAHGVAAWAANAFEAISQLSTLVLVAICTIRDVVAEVRHARRGFK